MIDREKALKMRRYAAGIPSPGYGRDLPAVITEGAL